MQELGRQPLFQLIGAIIVLLAADWRPMAGLAAAALWIVWVTVSFSKTASTARLFTTHK
jgi:hypothetical protein